MNLLLARIIIPFLTILLPGRSNWFSSNFSVSSTDYPQNILLILWAIVVAGFYHTVIKRTIGRIRSLMNLKKERILTDLSASLLIGSVFLPYRPSTFPILAFFHLIMAFCATFLFYLTMAVIAVKLYPFAPDLFSVPAALIFSAAFISVVLLILGSFLITSALEIYLTVFSCEWLLLLDRRVKRLMHDWAPA